MVLRAEASSTNLGREFLAVERESDAELRGEGLLHLAGRMERRGEAGTAAEIYAALASDPAYEGAQRERARRRGAVLQGSGTVGDRVEQALGHFFAEATHPASLAAMAAGGLTFRVVRLVALGRLAASPASLWTRGWAARSAASFAGFAVEAPLFALSAKLGHQALGQSQDWSAASLGREVAASYLFLGALRLSGSAATATYRRMGGLPGSPLRSLFTQTGMFTGILGAHALNVQVGLAPERDGTSVLVDSLALLLQFNVAGRLSQRFLGSSGRAFERELELRAETVSRIPQTAPPFGPPFVFSMAHEGLSPPLPPSSCRPSNEMSSSSAHGRPSSAGAGTGKRASKGSKSSDRHAPTAREALRRLLDRSRPLEEEAKREVIRRIQAGDSRAEGELILSDIRWVYQLSKRYRLDGEERLDLLQEGQMGLLEAARRFDFSRENKFVTYATWWVRHYMTRYVSNYLQDVRIPVHQLDMMRLLRQELQELGGAGGEINAAELAERLDVSPERLEELKLLERSRYVESMESKRGAEEGYDLHERLPDKRPRADSQLVGRGLRESIETFIAGRSHEHDRLLLENRLFGEDELNHKELAQRLGSTPSRVRAYEDRLLGLLARYLESQGVETFGGATRNRATLRSLHPTRRERPAALPPSGLETSPGGRSAPSPFRPRIAIVGFGMAGVGAANALRNAALFSAQAERFSPRITVFEGMNRVGGKAAPDNLGAQFLDAAHFYPIDRWLGEHRLETTALRPDYDFAPYETRSGTYLSGNQNMRALRILRQAAREALNSREWEELDGESAIGFIRQLGPSGRKEGVLSAEEVEAMVSRPGFEAGTPNVSALSYAINLAKSDSPMPRYEVVGGIHRLIEAERAAVEAAGGEVLLGRPVRAVQAMSDGVRLLFSEKGESREERFDYAVLALAPESLRRVEITGTEMPLASVLAQDGLPHEYTSMPRPGKGLAVARFAMDQYFGGRYDAERLRVANHALGLGVYVRDAALAGEWAALSLLRGSGMDLSRVRTRRPDPERELIAAEKIR